MSDNEQLWREGLLSICQRLHMSLCGSADPLSDAERTKVVDYLQWRLDHWKESDPWAVAYDTFVKFLVQSVLTEADARAKETKP